MPNFFDDTFNPYTEEPEGAVPQLLNDEILNCASREKYTASFVDMSGDTWTMKCGYYQEGSLCLG
jgi:hypothetical protein